MISANRLREVLDYDHSTGIFTWKIRRLGVRRDLIAGTLTKRGYLHIKVDGKVYQAHRLVWLYVHGRWPIKTIDHVNGIGDDNRLDNLREASQRENARNRKISRASRSGLKGVYFSKEKRKWRAHIKSQYKHIFLGLFDSAELAHDAYCKAAVKYHGDFARF